MDNFIDWSDATSRTQNDPNSNAKQEHHVQSPSGNWQGQTHSMPPTSAPIQNPYNIESDHKGTSQSRQSLDYASSTYRQSYTNDAIMPASASSQVPVAQQQYMYSPMLTHQHNSAQHVYPPVADVSRQQQHSSNGNAQYTYAQDTQQQVQSFPHPYSYANGSNSYNPYGTQFASQSNYMAPYNNQAIYNGSVGNSVGNYPAQGVANHQQNIGPMSPQVQYSYQYQHNQPTPYSQSAYQQYQRPEDALNRVQQTWQGPKSTSGTNLASNQQAPTYAQWQTQPGQTVYFGMDARPIPPVKTVQKPVTPASPPRPSDPLAALRYDVSHCLNEYNTSRDLKGCTAALLAMMTTCDPSLSPLEVRTDGKDNVAPEKLSNPSNSKEELDPKIKQTALLSVVCSEIKGAMIEEVSQNKSIRAKLRTWFVRAHKDSSYVVLKALIAVLDKLTTLTAQSLAEVKFGKALIIVSRKCEDQSIRDSLTKWVPKAEESLAIERELEVAASKPPPLEDESKKKKPRPSAGKLATQQAQSSQAKKTEDKAKEVLVKKLEPVAKTNAAFFKRDNVPAAKPVIAKPGMAAALAGIKARKKTESDIPGTESRVSDQVKPTAKSSSSLATTITTSKPAFSALKLVEGLKRSASPVVLLDNESESKRQKKKKRVSWRPDSELEQIQIFETVEPEVGSWEVPQTPHQFGNARDLDRKEGALLHEGILPDRDEDFLDWENPRELDFNYRNLLPTSDMRGPKKGGSMKIHSKTSLAETERESTIMRVEYSDETDIPWSPSESAVMIEQRTMSSQKPKIIPLPAELRDDWRVLQVLGGLTSAQADEDATNAPPQLGESTTSQSHAGDASEPTTVAPVAPDITAILASIMAAQQKSSSTVVSSSPAQAATAAVVPIATSQPNTMKHEIDSAFPIVDHKLAEFLAQMATTNGGLAPPPLPPLPIRPIPMPTSNSPYSTAAGADMKRSVASQGQPLPPQFGGLRDVRPWVKFNDNGKYREPCRFISIGKCEKGDQCGYLHLDVPGPGHG